MLGKVVDSMDQTGIMAAPKWVDSNSRRWCVQTVVSELAQYTTTQCLARMGCGDPRAADELMPLVYDELRALAGAHLHRESPGHTLQPTALVHEAYLKLVEQTQANWQNRSHFFAVAAEAIRRILVDHARARLAAKRRAPGPRVELSADLDAAVPEGVDLIAIDEALSRLAELNSRQAKVVELRFFGGLSVEEAAAALGVSEGTIKGDWRIARAWLQCQLDSEMQP